MEITLTQLSNETGFTVSHLSQLIRRGSLPVGRKDGIYRYLPAEECRERLLTHSKNKHWRKSKVVAGTYALTWGDVI